MRCNVGFLLAAALASGCLDLASLTAGNGKDAAVANDLAINFPDGSTCNNGIKDGVETDVDCGGAMCPACPSGKMCLGRNDCQSGDCINNFCAAPQGDSPIVDMALSASCMDGQKNGQETDIDCGGPMCPACAMGKMCLVPADCQSADCVANLCGGGGDGGSDLSGVADPCVFDDPNSAFNDCTLSAP